MSIVGGGRADYEERDLIGIKVTRSNILKESDFEYIQVRWLQPLFLCKAEIKAQDQPPMKNLEYSSIDQQSFQFSA